MRYVLMLSLAFFSAGVCFGQQWFPENGPWNGRTINSVWILQKGQIVVAGGNEYNDSIEDFGRTSNSGLNWDSFRDTISSWIKSVAFIDTATGYATGYNGKLIKTGDGGNSWVYGSSPVIRDFNKIIYVTPTLMFLAGGRQANDSVQTILKSTNGGNTWVTVYDQPGPWLKSICFINANSGFATGDNGTILNTADGGNTWTPIAAPVIRNFNAAYFIDANKGFIVGGADTDTGEISTILQTINGGLNWTVIRDTVGNELFDISFSGSLYGLIVGDSATLLKTINGGQAWIAQTIATAETSESFNAVKIYDSSYAVIGTNHSRMFVYTTGTPPQAHTLLPQQVDTVSATLVGSVNTSGLAGIYWFTYSTDSLLLHYSRTPQQSIFTDSPTVVTAPVNLLKPDTTYYYYVTVSNIAGTVRGNVAHFFTGKPYLTSLQTLVPHNINPQSATLYAQLNANGLSANAFFQYGIEQAFDHEVQANPSPVSSDTALVVSVAISGLQPGQQYYYRLKATDSLGTYYSEARSFFAVHNQIPNWNFENWQPVERRFPHGWWAYGNVELAPSYNGTTALSVFGNATVPYGASFTGIHAHDLEFGGSPFSARPDSLIFYANYDVTPGDTALVLLAIKTATMDISNTAFPLTGSTLGTFKRMALPISYISNATPDSAIIGFTSTNILINQPVAASWLMVDDISFAGTTQNVPSPGFEQWDSSSYLFPTGWSTTYTEFPINFDTQLNIDRTTDSYFGEYAVVLHNNPTGSNNQFSSRATVTTNANPDNGQHPSFAVTKHYKSFNGYLKYTPQGNDTAVISVALFRAGNILAWGSVNLDTAITVYSPFFIPLNYNYGDSASIPDSATISITDTYASPIGTARLVIDNLGFDGYYEGDSVYTEAPIVAAPGKVVSLNVYPNPNNGNLEVDYLSPLDEEITLTIYDINGRPVYTESGAPSPGNKVAFKLSLGNLPQSVYFIRVKSKSAEVTSRFVVAR